MKKNILCIDDIESNLFILTSLFETVENSSYEIFTALSAEDGFEILRNTKIDLILLDVMMPEVDGFAMAKMVKSNKKLKNIPIIFVTAKTDDETIERCYGVGGSDYVSKPFNHIELLKRIDFHLKFRDKEKLLQKEKEYAQNIVDLQDNIIIITDGNQVINLNKALLDFFEEETLFAFQKKYSCICDNFEKEEGCFHLGLVQDTTYWLEDVIERLKSDDVVVAFKNKEQVMHSFTIKAKRFYDLYILTLTDITIISNKTNRYKHEANFDALTQIYNRNMFYQLMEDKLHTANFKETDISFTIMDIDHFKNVNDTYGHLVGDSVLKQLATLVSKHIRGDDIFARWGGEEFIIALDTDIENATKIIENIRHFIEKEIYEEVGTVTCSFGLTDFRKGDTIKSITNRADEALYEAKESGRNRVCSK